LLLCASAERGLIIVWPPCHRQMRVQLADAFVQAFRRGVYSPRHVWSACVSVRVGAMNKLKSTRLAGFIVVVAAAAGCAGTPSSAPDRTPSWQKYTVTGSHIRRPVDGNGNPEGQGSVVVTTPSELEKLPSVTVRRH
jgi:hypothetical protein